VFYRIHRINKDAGTAIIVDSDGNESEHPVASLTVAKEFGDVMYPGLRKLSEIRRGDPDTPVHTIINGENYHALEALQYTHAGKVDLIYIDPPYNTGAADWKYNDRYVDARTATGTQVAFLHGERFIEVLLKPTGVIVWLSTTTNTTGSGPSDQVFGEANFVECGLAGHQEQRPDLGGVDYMTVRWGAGCQTGSLMAEGKRATSLPGAGIVLRRMTRCS
jgi:adenine-specific DNA-methyltransferase